MVWFSRRTYSRYKGKKYSNDKTICLYRQLFGSILEHIDYMDIIDN